MPVVNVDIPEELKIRLLNEARRDMRSQRSVLVLALERYLAEREQASGESATMDSQRSKDGTGDEPK